MTIAEMIISELNSLGYLNRGSVSINEIEKIKIKYKYVEDDVRDKSFLAGFSDGFRSDTGIPNEIMKELVKTTQIKKMIANLQYGFEKSKGVQKLEGGWVSASLTSYQEEIFNKLWHLYANTRIDFAIMLITDKWS